MQDETLYQGRWLNLKRRGRWEFVERVNPGGAVAILAVTDAGSLLLVEQPRVPIGRTTIELPAGLIGDSGHEDDEPLAEAARRELEEETGYTCRAVELLHSGPTSAGMSTEFIHFVHATGLARIGPGGGDDSEEITVHEVPLDGIDAWLAARAAQGNSIDPKLMAGLWLLAHPRHYNRDA
ncbi:MAG TPA: NUDIX hydrolase [Rhodanobacteraceae bacterium]|nr:NUDIX hydrolase [Rhodanobacteraceae bacterium]